MSSTYIQRRVNVCADKGDVGVAYTIARLTELGWTVGVLLTEHARYDLLAEKNGKFIKVQVRYVVSEKDRIPVKLVSKWRTSSGNKRIVRQQGDYDILAVFCPCTKKVYFVSEQELGTNLTGITLRLKPTNKANGRKVRMADDFLEI
jgi:Protein of unknown function (DUF3257).